MGGHKAGAGFVGLGQRQGGPACADFENLSCGHETIPFFQCCECVSGRKANCNCQEIIT